MLLSALLAFSATPSAARVATLTFTGIGQVNGAAGGAFASANFVAGDVVDMTIQIEETTSDSNAGPTAGTFNDPSSVTTFSRQLDPADTVTFTGFGFELLDPSRLDQASMPIAAEGTYFVSGFLRDWDLWNISPPISDVNNLFTILAELPIADIGFVAADGFAIGAPDATDGNVTEFTSMKPTVTLTVGCGNGFVDAGEACDDPFCCDATCDNPVTDGTECRAAAGPCDVAETCSSGACPADAFVPIGTECQPSLGDCDIAEECSGSSAECPPDTLSQFTCGTICRPAQGACDTPDFCTSFAETENFDCPGEVTLCTPTATSTATSTDTSTATSTATSTNTSTATSTATSTSTSTATPTATATSTSTATATATAVPEGGVCATTSECERDLYCVEGTCADLTMLAPTTSKAGLLIALAILMLAAYTGMRRGDET